MSFLINPYVFQAEVAGANSILAHATMASSIRSYYSCTVDGSFPDSTNRVDGTITNAVYTTSGKISGAYDFDGAGDKVTIANEAYQNMTVSCWVKFDNIASDGRTIYQDKNMIFRSDTDGDMFVQVSDNRNGTGALTTATNVAASLSTSTWYHIVVTCDSSETITVYVDNDSKSFTGSTDTTSQDYDKGRLGVRQGTSADYDYMDGQICEVGVWDRVLTTDEISDLYNSGNGLPWQVLPFSENATLTDNLKAYWQMEGQSMVDVWGTFNGINNGATFTDVGKVDHDFDFDGTNDYIDMNDNFKETGDFSISGWFRTDTVAPAFQYVLATQGSSSFQGYIVRLETNTLVVYLGDGSDWVTVSSTTTIVADTWYQFTMTYDASTDELKLYLDASNEATATQQAPAYDTNDFRIGSQPTGANYFNGDIDEVGVWTKVLTPTEITALNNSTNGLRFRGKFQDSATLSDVDHYFSFRNAAESDSSGASGTVNGATYTTEGIMGNAYDFDGTNDYIEMDNQPLPTSGAWSVSCWINGDDVTKGDEQNILSTRVNAIGSSKGMDLWIDITSGQVRARVYDNGGTYSNGPTLSDATWYHIVVTYDGSDVQLWSNGTSTTAVTGSYDGTGANNLVIGKWANGSSQYFEGKIAEVGTWDRKLTDDEIAELYNGGLGLRFY